MGISNAPKVKIVNKEVKGELMARRIFYLTVCLILTSPIAFSQSRGFGVGLMLGMPTGLTVKAWTSSTGALQFGAGWRNSLSNTGTYITGEYLWHAMNFIKANGHLPLYAGIGGVIGTSTPTVFGVRGIFGLAVLPRGTRLDIFLQLTPVFYFSPSPAQFDLDGGVGFRYYFF